MGRNDNKTEQPTARKKREGRREGKNARSAEVGVAFSLIGLLIGLRIVGPNAAGVMVERSKAILSTAGAGVGADLGGHVTAMVLAGLVPFLGIAVFAGLAGGVSQVGFTIAPKAAKPKLSHLSIKKGLERLRPSMMAWELIRNVIKLGLLGLIMWEPLVTWVQALTAGNGLSKAVSMTANQVWAMLLRAALLAVIVAGADYAFTKKRATKQLRMTRQEVRDELKNTEGDPLIRTARRRRALDLSRKPHDHRGRVRRRGRDQPDAPRCRPRIRPRRGGPQGRRQGVRPRGRSHPIRGSP